MRNIRAERSLRGLSLLMVVFCISGFAIVCSGQAHEATPGSEATDTSQAIVVASFTPIPMTLQVGVNIYTDSAPDLQARYDNIKMDGINDPTECEW